MASFFGFQPSSSLNQEIDTTLSKAKQGTSEPLYTYRDSLVNGVNHELIDAALVKLVDGLPESDRKQSLQKATQTIQSTVTKLMNQLLSKASNDEVMPSINYLENALHQDNAGNRYVGFALPDDLATRLRTTFAAVERGEGKAHLGSLAQDLKFLADLALRNFMADFNKTLNLGMIKRTAASAAYTVIEKVLHVIIDKLVPSLSDDELRHFTAHYNQLVIQK